MAQIYLSSRKQLIILLLALSGCIILIEFMGWQNRLAFAQVYVADQPWRLLSAVLVHNDWSHALLNIAALTLVVLVFQRHYNARTLLNAIITIAVISSILIWIYGSPASYGGLSGVIHGVLLMSLLLEYQPSRASKWESLTLLAIFLVVLKVVAEAFGWLRAEEHGTHVWALHLAGLLAGIVAWLWHRRQLRQLTSPTTD